MQVLAPASTLAELAPHGIDASLCDTLLCSRASRVAGDLGCDSGCSTGLSSVFCCNNVSGNIAMENFKIHHYHELSNAHICLCCRMVNFHGFSRHL